MSLCGGVPWLKSASNTCAGLSQLGYRKRWLVISVSTERAIFKCLAVDVFTKLTEMALQARITKLMAAAGKTVERVSKGH